MQVHRACVVGVERRLRPFADAGEHPRGRVRQVGRAVGEQRHAALAVVIAVVLDVELIEGQRRLDRIGEIRLGVAGHEVGLPLVVELVAAAEGELGKLGVQFVEAVLDPQVDIVERALDERVAGVDGPADQVGLGDAAGAAGGGGGGAGAADAQRRRLQVAFLASPLEVGVEDIEVEQRPVVRPPLKRAGGAPALLVVGVVVEAGKRGW